MVNAELIERLDPADDFNYEHFRMRHMIAELLRPVSCRAARLRTSRCPSTDGSTVRLSDLRGRPVLLHFVSYTCPVTAEGWRRCGSCTGSTARE